MQLAVVSTGHTRCCLVRGIDPLTNHTISRLFSSSFIPDFSSSTDFSEADIDGHICQDFTVRSTIYLQVHNVSSCICGWIHHYLQIHNGIYWDVWNLHRLSSDSNVSSCICIWIQHYLQYHNGIPVVWKTYLLGFTGNVLKMYQQLDSSFVLKFVIVFTDVLMFHQVMCWV